MKKIFGIFVVGMGLLVVGVGSATASVNPSSSDHGVQSPSNIQDTRVRDSKRQVARLSKKLKLTSNQKLRVLAILSDRDRQIELIQGSESLPNAAKGLRIRKIVEDSNVLLENVLDSNQQQKFEKVLALQSKRKDRNRQA